MPDRETARPGFIVPRPQAQPNAEDLGPPARSRPSAGCFAAAGIFFLFVSLLIGPTISAAVVPAAVVVFATVFTYYLTLDSREQKHRRHIEILRDSCGRDYITVNMVASRDRPTLRRAQHAVDTILGTPLHRSGYLMKATRNTSLLCGLEWRIACDLYRVASAERDLAESVLPHTGGDPDRTAYERAAEAFQRVRSQAEEQTAALQVYAERVQHAQGLLDRLNRSGEHRPIAVDLPAERVHLPDEVTDSLAAARKEARKVSRIHAGLGS